MSSAFGISRNAESVRARLEEGREWRLGTFGEPVWSQALACLDALEGEIIHLRAENRRLTEDLEEAEELAIDRLTWGDSEDW